MALARTAFTACGRPSVTQHATGRRAVVSKATPSSRLLLCTLTCLATVGLMLTAYWLMHPGGIGRRLLLGAGLGSTLVAVPMQASAFGGADQEDATSRQGEVRHTEREWEEILGPDSYQVMRLAGTERRFTSPLNDEKRKGTFACAGCGAPLFASSTKYNSGTGWPSFYDALPGAVDETSDNSIFFMPRVEVRCHRCQGHLGHVFDDGPQPTGLRYCMNGVALKFVPEA